MKKKLNLDGIASRIAIIRKEKQLSNKEMAAQLGISTNDYRKYERAIYSPQIYILELLARRFGISLNWFILNKGPMYSNDVETALQKPNVPPDAMMVTSPEIKELIGFMEDNPVHKFQLLTYFYNYKQKVKKTEDNDGK